MTNGGFLDQNKHTNKIGLTLVIAGHAAVLTAIALAPPEAIRRIVYLPQVVQSYKKEAPPPPRQLPPPQPAQKDTSQPTKIEPLVDTGQPVSPIDLSPTIPRPLPPTLPQVPVAPEPALVPATMDPSAMARFQPDYPSELVRAEVEGSATVRVLIGSDGRVQAVELVSATHPGFFEATKRQALRYWKFRAATRDGIATESWRTMTVRFTLQG